MKRIGVYIEPWVGQHAGIAVYIENLVKALDATSFQVVTIGSQPVRDGVEHLYLSAWKFSYLNPFRYLKLNRFNLSKHEIDLIIDPAVYSTWGLFFGADSMIVVHDLIPMLFPEYQKWRTKLAFKYFLKPSIQCASRVLTVSEQTKKDTVGIFDCADKCMSIYPAVRHFSISTDVLDNTMELGDYMLVVGTIEPRKNHARIIQAFDRFCEQNQKLNLVIVGGEGWQVSIDQLVSESRHPDRIKVYGYVNNELLESLYRHASFSVYCSLYEGFGFPIVEAMQCDCPVITSDVGSMKEIAGEAAKLVDPTSVEEISNAMILLARDRILRQELIDKGNEQAKKYSQQALTENLQAILEEYFQKQSKRSMYS